MARPILSTLSIFLLAFAGSALTGCASNGTHNNRSPISADNETGMIMLTTTVGDESQPSALYVPANYDPSEQWPLIVFLHGIGERGSDGESQTTVGIGPAIEANPDRFPCLVLMPQCSTDYVWTTDKAAAHIDDAIAQATENYNVDAEHILLTGLSMGGFGSFLYGAKNIDRIAAIMPICGGGNPRNADKLAKVPMWVFHGGADNVVPPSRSIRMVDAIKAAGGDIRYTEYPGIGHNSWDKAYGDPEAIAWLLAQRTQ